MRSMSLAAAVVVASLVLQSCDEKQKEDKASLDACVETLAHLLPVRPQERADRFQGKVEQFRALCRGGQKAVAAMKTPWVDWGSYWGTGDASSQFPGVITSKGPLSPSGRGVTGALPVITVTHAGRLIEQHHQFPAATDGRQRGSGYRHDTPGFDRAGRSGDRRCIRRVRIGCGHWRDQLHHQQEVRGRQA